MPDKPDPEYLIQSKVMLAASEAGTKIFRNNVGFCECNKIKFGLVKGSSDLIGWTPVKITPAHVGQTMAIFTAIEVKTAKGRASKEQDNFIRRVQDDGGYAGIARSEDDVEGITNAD